MLSYLGNVIMLIASMRIQGLLEAYFKINFPF